MPPKVEERKEEEESVAQAFAENITKVNEKERTMLLYFEVCVKVPGTCTMSY